MKLTDQVKRAQIKNILTKLKDGKTITRHEQTLIAQYEAGTLPDLTLEEVAEHFQLSRAGVLRWKRAMGKQGLPWTSIEGIQKWRDSKEKESSPGDINGVKKQKLEREVKRLDLKIAVEFSGSIYTFMSVCIHLMCGCADKRKAPRVSPRSL